MRPYRANTFAVGHEGNVSESIPYLVQAATSAEVSAAGEVQAESAKTLNRTIRDGMHRVTPSAARRNEHGSFRWVSNHPLNCFAPSGVVRTCILMRVPLR